MKNVYSLAYFRNGNSAYESERCGEARGKFFTNYIRAVVRAFHFVYGSAWELVIAHDDRVMDEPYFKVMVLMQEVGLIKLRYFGQSKTLCGISGMLERLRPIFEQDVKYVACRDIDSLPQPRERVMLEEFMLSGSILHAIHDSISHCGLMGGTLGIDAEQFRNKTGHTSLESLIEAGDQIGLTYNAHGDDQRFLNAVVYPYLAPDLFIHTKRVDSPLAKSVKAVAPAIHPLDRFCHVGGAFNVEQVIDYFKENRHQSFDKIERSECLAEKIR